MQTADEPIQYSRYRVENGWDQVDARVIVETTVTLTVNGEVWLSFNCTPTDLDALAAGFLYNEGMIQGREEIAAIDVCKQGDHIDVWLKHAVQRPQNWRRTSGCTGGVTAAEIPEPRYHLTDPTQITALDVLTSMDLLLQAQDLYRETGGVHCSAICDGRQMHLRAEDIGRHNTLDKLAGRLLLTGKQVHPIIVVTTGRISAEMLQKCARLGAIAVASRTSPTSQSVALAQDIGITLIGYARRNGFQVYAHPERLING